MLNLQLLNSPVLFVLSHMIFFRRFPTLSYPSSCVSRMATFGHYIHIQTIHYASSPTGSSPDTQAAKHCRDENTFWMHFATSLKRQNTLTWPYVCSR